MDTTEKNLDRNCSAMQCNPYSWKYTTFGYYRG
jgi:hypothetical protein